MVTLENTSALKSDAEISRKCAIKDIAHLVEMPESVSLALQDIAMNVRDALCMYCFTEYTY